MKIIDYIMRGFGFRVGSNLANSLMKPNTKNSEQIQEKSQRLIDEHQKYIDDYKSLLKKSDISFLEGTISEKEYNILKTRVNNGIIEQEKYIENLKKTLGLDKKVLNTRGKIIAFTLWLVISILFGQISKYFKIDFLLIFWILIGWLITINISKKFQSNLN